MTGQHATKLLALIIDTYGDNSARLVVLGRGDEYAVRIASTRGCFFCWNFEDWTAYRHQEKQQAKKARKRREDVYQTSIDYSVQHQVLVPLS